MSDVYRNLGIVGIVSTLLVATALALQPVRTPFGLRPQECVLEVPHGARVEDHPDGTAAVLVTLTNGESYRHESPAVCSELPPRGPRHAAAQQHVQSGTSNMSCNAPPCTCTSLPCNDWIDNAGSMNTTDYIGGMSATYVTPGNPQDLFSNQTLFYFIGAENTDGYPRSQNPRSYLAILQPVLTFDPSGWCINGSTGWCFASWYCCPQNLTVHSEYLQHVRPGDVFVGSFNLTYKEEFIITSRNMANGALTTLVAPRQERNFNWADVTQEVYGMETCRDFAVGKMWFLDISVWDVHGRPMTPSWLFTSNKPCNGKINVVGNDMFVSHNE